MVLSCSFTCSGVVGLRRPKRLALGAATGTPACFIIFSATLFLGILTATVFSPEVTISGTLAVLGPTMVSGPGQYFSASCIIIGEIGFLKTVGSSSIEEIGRASSWYRFSFSLV